MASLVKFTQNRGRFELEYKPTCTGMRRIALERRERSTGQPQGLQVKGVPLCHIDVRFVNTGWMCEGRVSVIHEETPQDQPNWVRPCPPKFELGNWRISKQPRISVANSISNNKSSKSSDTEDPDVDFEQLINQAEDGEDED